MSIDQIELILYDMFEMDAWEPPLLKRTKKAFQVESCSRWTIHAMVKYIRESLYPQTEADIFDFVILAQNFAAEMKRCANVKPSLIFSTAADVSASVVDLLRAIK